MKHPTDDELEALAQYWGAQAQKAASQDAMLTAEKFGKTAAMLRACKGRGNDCLIEFDNGEKISLSSFSGGAAPEGIMGSITLIKEDEDGKATFRAYKSVTDWQSGLQDFAALDPAPDHETWNAAIEAAAQRLDADRGPWLGQNAAAAIRQLKKGGG